MSNHRITDCTTRETVTPDFPAPVGCRIFPWKNFVTEPAHIATENFFEKYLNERSFNNSVPAPVSEGLMVFRRALPREPQIGFYCVVKRPGNGTPRGVPPNAPLSGFSNPPAGGAEH